MKIIKHGWRIIYRSFAIWVYREVRVTFNETCNTAENEIESATKWITLNAFTTKSRFRTSPPSSFFFFLTRGNISIYQRYIVYTFLNTKITKLYSDDEISLSWRWYAACKTSERNFPDIFKATAPRGVTKGERKKENEREREEGGRKERSRRDDILLQTNWYVNEIHVEEGEISASGRTRCLPLCSHARRHPFPPSDIPYPLSVNWVYAVYTGSCTLSSLIYVRGSRNSGTQSRARISLGFYRAIFSPPENNGTE